MHALSPIICQDLKVVAIIIVLIFWDLAQTYFIMSPLENYF